MRERGCVGGMLRKNQGVGGIWGGGGSIVMCLTVLGIEVLEFCGDGCVVCLISLKSE